MSWTSSFSGSWAVESDASRILRLSYCRWNVIDLWSSDLDGREGGCDRTSESHHAGQQSHALVLLVALVMDCALLRICSARG